MDTSDAEGPGEPNTLGDPEGTSHPQPGAGPGQVPRGHSQRKGRTGPQALVVVPRPLSPDDLEELSQPPSESQYSQPSRRRRKYRGAGTPRELWGMKLNEEYEEYRRTTPERRKQLWLSWTHLERQWVYVAALPRFRDEQRGWRAELEAQGVEPQAEQSVAQRPPPGTHLAFWKAKQSREFQKGPGESEE